MTKKHCRINKCYSVRSFPLDVCSNPLMSCPVKHLSMFKTLNFLPTHVVSAELQ